MLREDVLEAVADGKFHVWPVGKVEQGIEILTGRAAGERDELGKFVDATVFALVDTRLRTMANTMKDYQ
jgi:predicted ATP-dependent protease